MKAILKNNKLIIKIEEIFDISKDIDLRGIKITSLPEGLSVGGSLDLRGTKITSLPEGLSVGGYLYLSETKIKKNEIPKHLINKCIW